MPERNGLATGRTDGPGFLKKDFARDSVDANIIKAAHHGTEYEEKPGQGALQVYGDFEEQSQHRPSLGMERQRCL
jgi:hypothetical protein